MKKLKVKAYSGVVILTLLIATQLMALNIQTVSADPITIYIRADGSIDPPSAPISTVDGITYYLNSDISDSIVVEKDDIILDGLSHKMTGTTDFGIMFIFRKNVVVTNFEISGFSQGISVWGSEGCTFSENIITNCYLRGIYLGVSPNNNVINNVITDTVWDGIFITRDSDDNVVRGNVFERNTVEGIAIGWDCERTIVYENEVRNNYIGIAFGNDPSNSIVYHNNFIGNTIQVTSSATIGHVWDDGYPSGGNYWSDYSGKDRYQGVSQDIKGADMIGDTSYVIDGQNTDNYPLMNPWVPLPNTIGGLKELVRELTADGQIKAKGTSTALLSKLNSAQKLLDEGDIGGTVLALQSFIEYVQTLTTKQITPTAQYRLIQSAENVMATL